jgi:hypothetical protein
MYLLNDSIDKLFKVKLFFAFLEVIMYIYFEGKKI